MKIKLDNEIVMPVEVDEPSPSTPVSKGTRRLIKVDFSALQTDDDDDDDDDDEDEMDKNEEREDMETPKGRRNPWHRTGTTLTHDEYHRYCDTALECRVPSQSQTTPCRVNTCRII